jgi:hypothetical protein
VCSDNKGLQQSAFFKSFFLLLSGLGRRITFLLFKDERKGKVKHGDTYEKFIDYCGKGISFSGGARTLGKKNTIMSFKTFIKKYPDGSKIRVLFLDGKVAFLFNL